MIVEIKEYVTNNKSKKHNNIKISIWIDQNKLNMLQTMTIFF